MKKIAFATVILLLTFALFARDGWNADQLKKAGLTDQEIEKIIQIKGKYSEEKRAYRAEIKLFRAQLEKLLLDKNVNLKEVEKILREAQEWKLKSEMADIKQRIEIRNFLGDEKWNNLILFLKNRRDAKKSRSGNKQPRK